MLNRYITFSKKDMMIMVQINIDFNYINIESIY